MKRIKALQVASFHGNIGDMANHAGFRASLQKAGMEVAFDNLEMRNFYQSWGLNQFDEGFVDRANRYDLLVFGGGGFFELKWDYSATGTTIDLSEERIGAIKVPILFNCIGASLSKGFSESAVSKFGRFLEVITNRDNCFVTVRNDGSIDVIKQLYGRKFADHILKVPDGGFFCDPPEYNHLEIRGGGDKTIAINLAGDMPEVRFEDRGGSGRREFILEFADTCSRLLASDHQMNLVFVPHIWKDLGIIADVMSEINDIDLRTRVASAGYYNNARTGGLLNFSLYKKCDLVIGMRYHANVVPIGCGVPTILLGSYEPHICLYKDLQMEHRCIHVNQKDFGEKLYDVTRSLLGNLESARNENRQVMGRLQKENDYYMDRLGSWLSQYMYDR